MKKLTLLLIGLLSGYVMQAQEKVTPFNEAPFWSKNAVWYQIFVERFNNGDQNNDPKPENIDIPPIGQIAPANWTLSSWTGNWYDQPGWEAGRSFGDVSLYRRYGGDLQGVLNKLDYLRDLGVTALFMNPLNDATSSHKYDARSYHHIDVNFGPDPVGDNKIIANENPADPLTWKWTAADKLFLQFVTEAHKRGMKVIMDFSWNHTGVMFWAWQDILKNQSKSAYKDWYEIKSFDNPSTVENEFAYTGWAGVNSLPEVRKVNISTKRISGQPYEGNINEGAKEHIMAATRRWFAPDGIQSQGIDGMRLDVADQVGLGFWRDFRAAVRKINPEAYLVGEIWWEEFPDKLMNPAPYTAGDIFDGVMFYQVYKPARYFFAKTDFNIDAKQFKDSLEFQWNRLDKDKRYAMMNVSSSHDAPRLLTDFYNTNKYKFKASAKDNPLYKTGKPDGGTYQRLKLYLVHLFTTIGSPQIWNGEELGMWGGDDPDSRKPLWWPGLSFKNETRNNYQSGINEYDKVGFNVHQFNWYKKLIQIRRENPVLSTGDIKFLIAEGGKLAYSRYDSGSEIIVYFNMEPKSQVFELPAASEYINLLTNRKINNGTLKLNTLEAAILKKL